jgi:serine O-acetyltransferase
VSGIGHRRAVAEDHSQACAIVNRVPDTGLEGSGQLAADRIRLFMDLERNAIAGSESASAGLGSRLRTLLTLRYAAAFHFRLSQVVGAHVGFLGGLIKQFNQFLTGADIAVQARVDAGLVLFHPNGVVIGPRVQLGRDCVIQQGVTIGGLGRDRSDEVAGTQVGDRVFFGAGAKVVGDLTIGSDCIVGANAVVTKSGASNQVAVGIPAVWKSRSKADA